MNVKRFFPSESRIEKGRKGKALALFTATAGARRSVFPGAEVLHHTQSREHAAADGRPGARWRRAHVVDPVAPRGGGAVLCALLLLVAQAEDKSANGRVTLAQMEH